MARIRTIKPEFWTDSRTGTLSGLATKLFLGMLNHCDDYGVIRFDLWELKARILPFVEGNAVEVVVPPVFDELAPRGLVTMFGMHYDDSENVPGRGSGIHLHIRNFEKHQRVDKPGAPLLPGWKKGMTPDSYDAQVLAPQDLDRNSPTFPGAFQDRSENVPTGKEGSGGERKGVEGSGTEKSAAHSVELKLDAAAPAVETKKAAPPKKPPPPRTVSPDVQAVVDHYRTHHPKARPGDKERRLVAARLKDGFSVDDLKAAIDGCHRSPHNQGDNDRGRPFQTLELITRSSSKVTQFMETPEAQRGEEPYKEY